MADDQARSEISLPNTTLFGVPYRNYRKLNFYDSFAVDKLHNQVDRGSFTYFQFQ